MWAVWEESAHTQPHSDPPTVPNSTSHPDEASRTLNRTVLNSVLTAPGLMAVTRTAVPTRSCRAQSVKPAMKCFVPQYTEPDHIREHV